MQLREARLVRRAPGGSLPFRAPKHSKIQSRQAKLGHNLRASKSEVAKKSVSAHPGPILEGTLGTRMGPGRAGMATSGPGWVRNAVKQSTWRIWTGPLRTQDGTWTGPGSDPGEARDGTPRDSNRPLGLSEKITITNHWFSVANVPIASQTAVGTISFL